MSDEKHKNTPGDPEEDEELGDEDADAMTNLLGRQKAQGKPAIPPRKRGEPEVVPPLSKQMMKLLRIETEKAMAAQHATEEKLVAATEQIKASLREKDAIRQRLAGVELEGARVAERLVTEKRLVATQAARIARLTRDLQQATGPSLSSPSPPPFQEQRGNEITAPERRRYNPPARDIRSVSEKMVVDALNAFIAGYFFLASTLLFVLVPVKEDRYSMPWYSNFAVAGHAAPLYQDWVPDPRIIGHLSISWLSVIYNVTGFIKHMLCWTWFKERYHISVDKGFDTFRTAEYFIVYGIMHLQVAWVCGILDLHLLVFVFVSVSVVIMLAHFAQTIAALNNAFIANLCLALGVYLYAAQFATVASYLFYGAQNLHTPPAFVIMAWVVLTFFDGISCVVLYCQIERKGWFADAYTCEVYFLILGFLNKVFLTWTIYAGIQQLS